ncbi:MAG: hypothetical protein ACTSV1_02245 [Alphaproteobacteria bacterium]
MAYKTQQNPITDDMVDLFVPPSDFVIMGDNGDWPAPSDQLIYTQSDSIWHISPWHPMFEQLVESFGLDNSKAVDKWRQENKRIKLRFAKQQAQSGMVDEQSWLELPGFRYKVKKFLQVKKWGVSTYRIRKFMEITIGAKYSRITREYYISHTQQDNIEGLLDMLIEIYSE